MYKEVMGKEQVIWGVAVCKKKGGGGSDEPS